MPSSVSSAALIFVVVACGVTLLGPGASARDMPVVHGVGRGDYASGDGQVTCPDVAFVIEIYYLRGYQAGLNTEFGGTCVVGGVVIPVGVTFRPSPDHPLSIYAFCQGTRRAGLECQHDLDGTTLLASVGPYPRLGGRMTFGVSEPFAFEGTFTAV